MPPNPSLFPPPALIQLREQLSPVVQVTKLLVIDKKLLTDLEVFEQLCPMLAVSQIRKVLSNYTPDTLSPDPIPPSVGHTLDLLERREKERGGFGGVSEYDSSTVRTLSLSFLTDK